MLPLAALSLSLQLQRTSFDLLDGVEIELAVHNSGKTAVPLRFPIPDEYEIDILRGSTVIWTSVSHYPPNVTFPVHARDFLPGPTVLVVRIWNAIDSDGSTPGPGEYTVRAKLLDAGPTLTAQTTFAFIHPVPISALSKLARGEVVTIAGRLDAQKGTLTDASGSMLLMKRLLAAPPDAVVAVRGYLDPAARTGPAFFVQGWAVMHP